MSKLDLCGVSICTNSVPVVDDVKAVGAMVYVDLLSPRELMKTKLELTGKFETTVNEAYVLDLGPQVPGNYGIAPGDRVFINGDITFGPDYKDYKFTEDGRKRGMVLYTSIRGKIVEAAAADA